MSLVVVLVRFVGSIYRRSRYYACGSASNIALFRLFYGVGRAFSKESRVIGSGGVLSYRVVARRLVNGSQILSICGYEMIAAFMRRARVGAGCIERMCYAIRDSFVQTSSRRIFFIDFRVQCFAR